MFPWRWLHRKSEALIGWFDRAAAGHDQCLAERDVALRPEERDVGMQSGSPKDVHDTARGSVIFSSISAATLSARQGSR
jgi:hypothetical protein